MKYDVILWDNIGSPYSRSLVDAKAIGGSEYALVLLAEAFAKKGLKVLALGNGTPPQTRQNGVLYEDANHIQHLDDESCSVLIVSRFSSLPKNIKYDRVFVLAQDQPWENNGACEYDKFVPIMSPNSGTQLNLAQGTLVCMSEWHAGLFRQRYQAWDIIVIPAAIDDVHYKDAHRLVEKNPNKFVYASAAVKGWKATEKEWARLKTQHSELLDKAELHVTSPGYDKIDVHPEVASTFRIIVHDPVPARELSAFMADAAGLFFCNTYPESFCVVAAIAEIMGCRTHILVEPPGELEVFQHTLNSMLPTTDREEFERKFLLGYRGVAPMYSPKDFRMSTLIDVWMKTIGFEHHGTFNVFDAPDIYTKIPDELVEGLMGFKLPAETGEKISYTMSVDGPVEKKPYSPPTLTQLTNAQLEERGLPEINESAKDYPMLENRGRRAPEGFKHEIPLGVTSQLGDMTIASLIPPETREMKTPTLGLVLIAKNEASVLPRALASAKGLVDFFTVILDKRNDDDSEGILISHSAEIPEGPFHSAPTPFAGHAAARNEAIRVAAEKHHTDFIFMLDADDSLAGVRPTLSFDFDGYEVDIIDGDCRYRRLSVFKPGAITFKRRAHEYPETKPGAKIGYLPEIQIIRGQGGDARKDPYKKFLKDISLLEQDLAEMPNDPRTIFYLAQSHRDAARALDPDKHADHVRTHFKRARAYYVQRAMQSNTWNQERFMARIRAGELSELFGEPFYAKAHYLAALEEDPRRWPEAAVCLVRLYNSEQKFELALTFGRPPSASGHRGPDMRPPADALFVDLEPYHWKLKMEVAVAIFYLGNKEQSGFWTQQLIDSPLTPEMQKETLRKNLEFCK